MCHCRARPSLVGTALALWLFLQPVSVMLSKQRRLAADAILCARRSLFGLCGPALAVGIVRHMPLVAETKKRLIGMADSQGLLRRGITGSITTGTAAPWSPGQ